MDEAEFESLQARLTEAEQELRKATAELTKNATTLKTQRDLLDRDWDVQKQKVNRLRALLRNCPTCDGAKTDVQR